jgi:putative sigma-54 modulation protein
VQVKISARHGHLSETAHQMIEEKASNLLHFFDRLTMIEVTVDLGDDLNKVVEILAKSEHKHDFIARESASEIPAALDQAIHKIERQLTKHKEKIQDHRRRPPTGQVAGAPDSAEIADE